MSSSSNHPLCVGVTGGIGCGKSTVLAAFSRLGVPCFEADAVAAAYYSDPAFVQQVADLLGPSVRLADGSADKREIARIVFSDFQRLAALNSLIHPRVRADFARWRDAQAVPYVIFESAILYEHGLDAQMDFVICVYLEREERIRRLLERDNCSREALEARIANQASAEDKMMRADFVVLNYEGNPRDRQVRHIDAAIRASILSLENTSQSK